jgi:hypothetical protein
MWLFSML